jgi:carboxymethylenebutenolidase
MTADPVNINVPLLTGGVGLEEVRRYYSEHFIPKNPPDTEVALLSRTVGEDRLVDEMILSFTHTTQMDWMLPGVPPPAGGSGCRRWGSWSPRRAR